MDDVSEARLKDVHPVLAAKVRQLYDQLAAEHIYIRVVQGWRSVVQQNELYAQGRTRPGPRVTNCQGGHSYHNFGLAVDVVPSRAAVDSPFEPDWNHSNPAWHRMVGLAQQLGLECGAVWESFPDWPHLQLTGDWPVGQPPESARAAYSQGGLDAVWAIVGIEA